jgi:hypothetical protein
MAASSVSFFADKEFLGVLYLSVGCIIAQLFTIFSFPVFVQQNCYAAVAPVTVP